MKPRVLIPTGYGLNCEDETAYAFQRVGASVDKMHLGEICAKPSTLKGYQILAMIGGFSFGDHIAAGRVLANRYKRFLSKQLKDFIHDGKLIIGICNGFQVMTSYGLLPGFEGDYENQLTSLAPNDSGVFEDRWVTLLVNKDAPCVFTKDIDSIQLPVRHGEGKFTVDGSDTMVKLWSNNQIVLQYADSSTGRPTQIYPANPNGSKDAVAGICDSSGRVFGLMPHPEAYSIPQNHPDWVRKRHDGLLPNKDLGLVMFKNAVEYVEDNQTTFRRTESRQV